MTTERRRRMVWIIGLLAYLVGGLFWILAPFVIPFVGALVLLACVSAIGTERDDPIVMSAVVVEAVAGAILALRVFAKPAWLDPVLIVLYPLAAMLPIVVIGYRLARPWPDHEKTRATARHTSAID